MKSEIKRTTLRLTPENKAFWDSLPEGERGRLKCQWYVSSKTFIAHKNCALFIHPWRCPYKGYSKEGECAEFKQKEIQNGN